MEMIDIFGWISGICLALCGLPQAIQCIKQKSAGDISRLFVWLWTCGEVTGLIYVIYLGKSPLIVNYSFNTAICLTILYYCYSINNGDRK